MGDRGPGRRDARGERVAARPARHLLSRGARRRLLGRPARRGPAVPGRGRRAGVPPRRCLRDVHPSRPPRRPGPERGPRLPASDVGRVPSVHGHRGRRRARAPAAGLRLPRLRRASLQSAPGHSAAPAARAPDGGRGRRPAGEADRVHHRGVARAARRRRVRAPPAERAAVRRGGPASSRHAPGRPAGLARRPAGPAGRPRTRSPSRAAGPSLDPRRAGARRGSLALRAGRAVHPLRRGSPDAVPDARMQIAARLLAESTRKVAAVALAVGYDSEAAFSRAFKRAAGVPPRRGAGGTPRARSTDHRSARPPSRHRLPDEAGDRVEQGGAAHRVVVVGTGDAEEAPGA